jgi:hypothetical protein
LIGLLQMPVQGVLQTPLVQPFAHTLPHEPQLLGSVSLFISQPFELTVSQLRYPAPHVMLQPPPEQDAVPLAVPHTVPQVPQLLVSAASGFSQPFEAFPSQLP